MVLQIPKSFYFVEQDAQGYGPVVDVKKPRRTWDGAGQLGPVIRHGLCKSKKESMCWRFEI